MKIRFTKRDIFFGAAYIAICAILVFLWDFAYKWDSQFFSSMLAGILTIIGGALVAWWFFEREKARREKEREKERIEREIERKKRIISALTMFKNSLLSWIFHFACILSGKFLNYNDNLIYSGKYRNDIPELEDIFGIGTFDGQGRRLRGTEQASTVNDEVLQRPQTPQSLYGTLRYGLQSLAPIEKQRIEFPSLIEEVDPEVAKIVHLSNDIRSRIQELTEWEKKHEGKPFDTIDTAMKSNLRKLGKTSLNIVIAIEANIGKLVSEIQN